MPRKFRERYLPWKHRGVPLGHIRNGVYWIDRTIHGARRRVSTGCRTPDAAFAEYQRFEKDPARYLPRGKVGTGWDHAVAEYLVYSETVKGNGTAHVEKQESRLANLGSFERNGVRVFASLDTFTKDDINAFISALTSGEITGHRVGAPSVNRHLSDLKALMRWAREESRLTSNTADTEVVMRREESDINPHSEVEERRWKPVLKTLLPRWRAAAEVVLGAGLRPGELARMAAEDLLANAIHVPRSKTRKGRPVPASKRTLDAARKMLELGGFPDDNGAQFKRRVQVVAAKLGLEPFTAYDLRHTYATVCLRNGASLRDVQAWMGHARISTTEKYLHAAKSSKRASFAPF